MPSFLCLALDSGVLLFLAMPAPPQHGQLSSQETRSSIRAGQHLPLFTAALQLRAHRLALCKHEVNMIEQAIDTVTDTVWHGKALSPVTSL